MAIGLSLTLHGCGGGGSSSPAPPQAGFILSAKPSTLSIAPGTSSTVQVSIAPYGGFSGTVSVTASGPSGLSASPSSFTLQNAPQSVTLTADPSMATGTYSFSFSGTSGNLSNSATVSVGVGPPQTFTLITPTVLEVVERLGSTVSVPLQTHVCCPPGPDNYSVNFSVQGLPGEVTASFSPNPIAPGGSTTLNLTAPPNGQWIQNTPINVVATPTIGVPTQSLALDLVVAPQPGDFPTSRTGYLRTDDTPRAIIYDAAHQLIFSSDFLLNRVDVVSPSTRQIVKSIPVLDPGPLALTLDGSEVLVGSNTQQMTAISTTSLKVVQQWKLPHVSGGSYGSKYLRALSNGTVAVQTLNVDGVTLQFAIWDPAKNTMSPVALPPGVTACFVSGSATKMIVADCSSPSGVGVYDVQAGTFVSTITFPGYVFGVAAAPDGSRFLIFDQTNGINLYNAQLQLIAPVTAGGYISGFIFSGDGSRIYAVGVVGDAGYPGLPVIFVSDGSTGAFISLAPALGTIPPDTQLSPSPFAETPFADDGTGLIFGSADHGIGFDDSTYSVNYYIFGFNTTPIFDQFVTPTFGPVNAATPVSFPQGEGFGFIPDVWFAGVHATGATLGQGGRLTVNSPPLAQPGPVSVQVIEPDGTPIFNPLAFSYGPTPMFVSGDTATPAGGVETGIIGIGLPTDPSQIQVTVGGNPASVLSATPTVIEGRYFPFSYPYPTVDVKITVPPGNGNQDITLTTSAGSATLSKAIHYAQNVTDYKSPDTFQAVLLDRKRNQLYLSTGDHIDVFSLTTQQFLAPISPPALNGKKAFLGMAMTPDGAELLATNFPDESVALVNPDQPATATAVQVVPPGTCGNPEPERIATTNTGKAFIEVKSDQQAGCGPYIYELDLSTLQVTPESVPGFGIQFEGYPLAGSGDGSKLLVGTTGLSGLQQVAIYDAASNTWAANGAVRDDIGMSAAVSIDGSVFSTGSGLLDASADLVGYLAWQDVRQVDVSVCVPLEKIPDGGSLVYIPYPNFVDIVHVPHPSYVDIFDVNHGVLVRRISLGEQIQQVTDAMAIDSYGQTIYLITNAGLTVVRLGNAPLSIGHLVPSAGPAGTKVTVHGSGFQNGTVVTGNGSQVATTFVDPNTLQAIIPSLIAGSVQITVSNPAGATYPLDNAFTVQ